LLEVAGLQKSYGGPPVLRSVSLTLDPGEGVVLLGPNGAGKSTLLRILAGIHRASAGSVRIQGLAASFRVGAVRRLVGFVSHDIFLYDALTARENLEFFASLYGVRDRARIEGALAAAGLTRFADRPVGSFSRGMAQRLTLARARLHDPAILLLDEPFTGLDPTAASELEESLLSYRTQGGAFLMATHDLAHVRPVGTRLLVLRAGLIVHEETLAQADLAHLTEVYRTYAGVGIAGGGG
jgi:heme ABC exporter ATP-binding subunit CcmA